MSTQPYQGRSNKPLHMRAKVPAGERPDDATREAREPDLVEILLRNAYFIQGNALTRVASLRWRSQLAR